MIYKIEPVNEVARFRFLPRLNRPDLRRLYFACQEAEILLNSENVYVSRSLLHKFGKTALAICRILSDVDSFIGFPLFVSVIGIPVYLLIRLREYAFEAGEDIIAQNYTMKLIGELELLKRRTRDPRKREAIDKKIYRLKKSLERFSYE